MKPDYVTDDDSPFIHDSADEAAKSGLGPVGRDIYEETVLIYHIVTPIESQEATRLL